MEILSSIFKGKTTLSMHGVSC